MKNVESIVFLTMFFVFFVLIVCVNNLIEKKVFMRHKESLGWLKFDDINIEICLK